MDRLKAHLVAKGYTKIYDSDYYDTFSPITKIASFCLLLSMATMSTCPLYQLDIKNVFLHVDLADEAYMKQPLSFVFVFFFGGWGVWFGMQTTPFLIWIEIVSSNLV